MIAAAKQKQALLALHRILVVARFMAYQNEPAADIARILDCAEILPALIADDEDRTHEFRHHLQGLASQFQQGLGILLEFDRD
jgi:hypothetical protein